MLIAFRIEDELSDILEVEKKELNRIAKQLLIKFTQKKMQAGTN